VSIEHVIKHLIHHQKSTQINLPSYRRVDVVFIYIYICDTSTLFYMLISVFILFLFWCRNLFLVRRQELHNLATLQPNEPTKSHPTPSGYRKQYLILSRIFPEIFKKPFFMSNKCWINGTNNPIAKILNNKFKCMRKQYFQSNFNLVLNKLR